MGRKETRYWGLNNYMEYFGSDKKTIGKHSQEYENVREQLEKVQELLKKGVETKETVQEIELLINRCDEYRNERSSAISPKGRERLGVMKDLAAYCARTKLNILNQKIDAKEVSKDLIIPNIKKRISGMRNSKYKNMMQNVIDLVDSNVIDQEDFKLDCKTVWDLNRHKGFKENMEGLFNGVLKKYSVNENNQPNPAVVRLKDNEEAKSLFFNTIIESVKDSINPEISQVVKTNMDNIMKEEQKFSQKPIKSNSKSAAVSIGNIEKVAPSVKRKVK